MKNVYLSFVLVYLTYKSSNRPFPSFTENAMHSGSCSYLISLSYMFIIGKHSHFILDQLRGQNFNLYCERKVPTESPIPLYSNY